MRILCVIPARYASRRLPHKPLQPLHGRPLIAHVVERVRASGLAVETVVATDHEDIARTVRPLGVRAILTSALHASGTDRVWEVVARHEFRDVSTILNVQGDEPFVPLAVLDGVVKTVAESGGIATAACPVQPGDLDAIDRPKVWVDEDGRAQTFSREGRAWAGTPWRHIGVYGYERSALRMWTGLEPSPGECRERLEQLRVMDAGIPVRVFRHHAPVPAGVDTAEDLQQAEQHLTRVSGAYVTA